MKNDFLDLDFYFSSTTKKEKELKKEKEEPRNSLGFTRSEVIEMFTKNIWDEKKIKIFDHLFLNGELIEVENHYLFISPYIAHYFGIRRENINYVLTKKEFEEFERCANDVLYFGDNYIHFTTDAGIEKIELRGYQRRMLRDFQEKRNNIVLSSRQSGKTLTSCIFILWYALFNKDKNILIVANKGVTVVEIIDKIKTIYKHLPFFLKSGVKKFNQDRIVFENGCRIIGQSTTTTPALGFTIHLLYADEFAHVQKNIVDYFYRSLFPTLSSSKISKMIITSTPNGINKFYHIYNNAVLGKNDFNPIRIEWWEVPGRDEAWKEREIANLGSSDAFNQEYGNQFLTNEQLLIKYNDARFLERITCDFEFFDILSLKFINKIENLKFHPKYINKIDFKDEYFIISIDLADGISRDYSVMNIFLVEPLSLIKIKSIKSKKLIDYFRLKQIGIYYSNDIPLDEFNNIIFDIIDNLFDFEKIRIIIETNDHRGYTFIERMKKSEKFDSEIFIYNDKNKIGLKLNRHLKSSLISLLKNKIFTRNLLLFERRTITEILNFGLTKKGNYVCQIGNDDCAATAINLMFIYLTEQINNFIYEVFLKYEEKNKKIIRSIEQTLEMNEVSVEDEFDFSLLKEFYK